jgi:hypothetical protein
MIFTQERLAELLELFWPEVLILVVVGHNCPPSPFDALAQRTEQRSALRAVPTLNATVLPD